MSPRQAIQILMLSPFYFRLPLLQRLELIREYCQAYNDHEKDGKK